MYADMGYPCTADDVLEKLLDKYDLVAMSSPPESASCTLYKHGKDSPNASLMTDDLNTQLKISDFRVWVMRAGSGGDGCPEGWSSPSRTPHILGNAPVITYDHSAGTTPRQYIPVMPFNYPRASAASKEKVWELLHVSERVKPLSSLLQGTQYFNPCRIMLECKTVDGAWPTEHLEKFCYITSPSASVRASAELEDTRKKFRSGDKVLACDKAGRWMSAQIMQVGMQNIHSHLLDGKAADRDRDRDRDRDSDRQGMTKQRAEEVLRIKYSTGGSSGGGPGMMV
jgi:hypothetical protein